MDNDHHDELNLTERDASRPPQRRGDTGSSSVSLTDVLEAVEAGARAVNEIDRARHERKMREIERRRAQRAAWLDTLGKASDEFL